MSEVTGPYVTDVLAARDTLGADYVGLSEAARRLGLSVSRVRQLIDQGRLAGQWTPLGRIVLAADVEAEARRRRPGGKSGSPPARVRQARRVTSTAHRSGSVPA